MPPRRSSRSSRGQQSESGSYEENDLFRGGDDEQSEIIEARQVEDDLGIAGSEEDSHSKPDSSTTTLVDIDMEDAAGPSAGYSEPIMQEQFVGIPKEDKDGEPVPQIASTMEEDKGPEDSIEKGHISSTLSLDDPLASSNANSGELLASLPVYFNTSLPSSSTLQVFQYPTYSRGHPLPFPQSARERGLQPAMRTRPHAKRVEVELPLDLRPPVYNADRGEEFGEGATAAGSFGPPNGNASSMKSNERRVKIEFGGYQSSPSSERNSRQTLEKTRLESNQLPHQTQYMLGVIRNRAVHLTPVDSIHQLRPSMHYIDALEAMKRQQDKAAEEQRAGEENEEGGRTNSTSANRQRKVQNLNVSIRNDSSGPTSLPPNRQGGAGGAMGGGAGGSMAGGVGDNRDFLMQAEREAESERWISLDWRIDENSDEARKTFESQLFAIDKTTRLQCKTKPREYLQM